MIGTVNFSIAGKKTNSDDLLIVIPGRYKDLFRDHDFNNYHELSMALMYASCAAEARYYNHPWKTKEDEAALNRILQK